MSLVPEETRKNLIVNYLPQTLTDDEFRRIFEACGPISKCRIMRDLKTNYSFGYGFVEYDQAQDAQKAIVQLNNLPLQHKRLKVAFARPPGDEIKETNLYVQNIPRDYTITQFSSMFEPFGMIVQKNLLADKITGMPRGVGFVRYSKKDEADDAIRQMNGKVPPGGTIALQVRVAEDHGKMKNAYNAGFQAAMNKGKPGQGGQFDNMRGGKMSGMGRGGNRFNPLGRGGENYGGAQGYGGGYGGGYGQDFAGNDYSGGGRGNNGVAPPGAPGNAYYNRF